MDYKIVVLIIYAVVNQLSAIRLEKISFQWVVTSAMRKVIHEWHVYQSGSFSCMVCFSKNLISQYNLSVSGLKGKYEAIPGRSNVLS